MKYSKIILLSLLFLLVLVPQFQIVAQDGIFCGEDQFDVTDGQGLVDLCTAFLEENPEDLMGFFFLGYGYYELGEFETAIEQYSKAIELDPTQDGLYSERGTTYSQLGEYELALKDFDQAIALYPNYEKAYGNRAEVYLILERYEEALADYMKSIEIDPEYEYGYQGIADVYYQQEDFDKAIEYATIAIDLNPFYASAYETRGLTYLRKAQLFNSTHDYIDAMTYYKLQGNLDAAQDMKIKIFTQLGVLLANYGERQAQ
jgi:tetratricopeptide (TPR) repeat protein